MLRRICLVLMALACGCDARTDVAREASTGGKIIEIPPIAEATAHLRALVTEKSANDILSTISPTDSGLLLPRNAAAILTRTGFVVTDGQQLHIFDSSARLLGTHGGRGEGPGEYNNLYSMCFTSGDTLVVFDIGLNRVSVLAPDGEYVRGFSVGSGAVPPRNACFSDGTFLVVRPRSRYQFTAYRYGLDGGVRDSSLVLEFDSSLGGFQILVESTLAVFQDSILFGDPWEGSVRLYDVQGDLNRTLRLVGLHPGPIPDDIVPYVRPKFGPPVIVRAKVKNFPYFQRILVAPNGILWYNDFPRNKHEAMRWYGFTPDGRRAGSIELDSSVVVNGTVLLEDFGTSSVLLRIEDAKRGSIFRIVPIADLRSQGPGYRN